MNRDALVVAVMGFLAVVVFVAIVCDYVWGGNSHRGGGQ